jgi:Rps23 Pro-64 3,4-dihydroxylase Tpa1-like proline 4-hydroxylase
MTINMTGFLPIQTQHGFQLDDENAYAIGQTKMNDYAFAEPFCHAVIENFLPQALAENILEHFPVEPKAHDKIYQKGYGGQFKRQVLPADCDEYTRNLFGFFNSSAMLKFLEGITNIQGLLPDPYFAGGGFHEISTGGLLGIHADFRVNEGLQLIRRVNVLIYLNKNWQETYGGKLELWDKAMTHKAKEIAPLFNRCVIFNTDVDSFHGHPEPLTTPADITRKSIALYYYTALPIANDTGESRHTNYVARPNDSAKNIADAKKLAKKRDKRAKKMFGQNDNWFNKISQKIKSYFD